MHVHGTSSICCVQIALIFCTVFTYISCSYDWEAEYLASPGRHPYKMIRKNGYPAETHYIQYGNKELSELHRIPHGRDEHYEIEDGEEYYKYKIPVLLHHGLFSSSYDWIINGPKNSLAYGLADQGYDVWMVNARGNEFTYDTASPSYRKRFNVSSDFSFHQMGKEDLPTAINYILGVNGHKKLIHIGHSLGSTAFYVMASELPEFSEKILFQISLAPIGSLGNTESAFKKLLPKIEQLHRESKNGKINKDSPIFDELAKDIFCKETYHDTDACLADVIYQLFGSDPEQLNPKMLPLIKEYVFSGTYTKNIIHLSKLITTEQFSRPDYREDENKATTFSSTNPPRYHLSNIKVPIRVYYGQNDILATPRDVKKLYRSFPSRFGLVKVKNEKFNHVDFLWAKDANRLVYDKVIHFMKRITDPKYDEEFIQESVKQNEHELA